LHELRGEWDERETERRRKESVDKNGQKKGSDKDRVSNEKHRVSFLHVQTPNDTVGETKEQGKGNAHLAFL
jgi:hypothetical protein